MFNFAARSVSEHTAKPIDGFKRGLGPVISILQNIITCYRIKYYQKLSIVRCDHGNYKSRFDRPEPARSLLVAAGLVQLSRGELPNLSKLKLPINDLTAKTGAAENWSHKVTWSHNIYLYLYTNGYDCRDAPVCPRRQRVAQLVIFFTAAQIYGLSHGPSKLLHTLILRPGQYTRYNLIKSHKCHQRVVFCWYWFSDLETHLHN